MSALSLEAHARCVQGLEAAAKVSTAFPEGSESVLCRHHLGAEAVHLHPLPGLCMGLDKHWSLLAFLPPWNRLLGPNNQPTRGVGGLRLQPLGQAGSSSPPGCRDPAEITRGSWCPSSPFAFQGPAKTCRSEHEPPGQDWNLNIHELPGYNQHPRCTGQMDTWEGRRESEGLTLQVRGAPNHHESWR